MMIEQKAVKVANTVLDLEPVKDSGFDLEINTKEEPLRLDNNELTIDPFPGITTALKKYLDSQQLNRRPDPESSGLLYSLSKYTGLPKDHIICFNGANMALRYLSQTYLEPASQILIGSPGESNIDIAAKLSGADVIEVEYDDPFAPDIESLINKIGKQTRMIYLCNPSDLTGSRFTTDEIIFLLAYAERAMVVIDEPYFEYCNTSLSRLVRKFPNLAIIRSFSKAFGLSSLNVAYMLTNPQNKVFINNVSTGDSIDSLSRIAATAALSGIDYIKEYVHDLKFAKAKISRSLPELGYEFQMTEANFFFLKVNDTHTAVNMLLQQEIIVKDISYYGQLDNYIRISIGTPSQTEKLLLALSINANQIATGLNRIRFMLAESEKTDPKFHLTAV